MHLNCNPVDTKDLAAMSSIIKHRGPDDEGFVLINSKTNHFSSFSDYSSTDYIQSKLPRLVPSSNLNRANIGLGHVRFSIIDLSHAGHQPFFSRDKSCCVVFNGEIYNYVELRDELVSLGSVFQTQSDTEVLVEAYRVWGTECFMRFNGFWAIALYDFRKRQLIISRDRLGKKPLFYMRTGNSICFSSEIKSLFKIKDFDVPKKVNKQSVFQWLAYGRKNVDNATCFEGIFSLPAGTWAVLDKTFPKNINEYWSVPEQRLKEKDISIDDAVSKLRNLMENSVKLRMHANVPISIELSGGMDSSTLVSLAAQQSQQKITTFTVRFPEKKWNEEPFARQVAEHCNVDYRVLESPTENFWRHISSFTYLEEEPYHSPNLQANQEVWGLMRSDGMKVSLNGAGDDELFAGYGRYFRLSQTEQFFSGHFKQYMANAVNYTQTGSFFKNAIKPLLPSFRNFSLVKRLQTSSKYNYLQFDRYYRDPLRASTLSKILYSDISNTLMPYWLASGDRGYMGMPIEVRCPFLDFRVVELAFQLPITYLIRDGWHKWILRKSMEDLLPHDVLWRKNKLGFPFALDQFYSDNQDIFDLIIHRVNNPYLDMKKYKSFQNNWRFLSFILWYEMFFNENFDLFKDIETLAIAKGKITNNSFQPAFHKSLKSFSNK